MKKFLLLSTIFVAGTAFAFGGIGIGHKSSSHKPGVNAIGIHIDPNGKKAHIITCADNEEPWEDKCLPKCDEGLERNTDGSCTVCANENVYLSYMDDPCGTDTPMNERECETGSDCFEEVSVEDSCCVEGRCRAGIYQENSDSYVCPSIDKKTCSSNTDCVKNKEFCNLTSTEASCLRPNVGTCMDIGSKDIGYMEIALDNIGTLRKSISPMTWWAAENWCKAQGMTLIDVQKFGCHLSGSDTLIIEGLEQWGECCKGNGAECGSWNDEDYQLGHYSPIPTPLKLEYDDEFIWTASNFSFENHCQTYGMQLDEYMIYGNPRIDFMGHALCE